MNEESLEKRIEAANDWIEAAKREIEAYKKLVRCPIVTFVTCTPKEPHMPLRHLQQAVEKMVKAMAIASGKFEYEELKIVYGHESLLLYADFILKLIEIPAVKMLVDTIEGKITKRSDVEIVSYEEAHKTLERIKANIRKRGKKIPEWYFEFALLPEKPMKTVLNNMQKSHTKIRIIRFFLRLIPDRLFTIERDKIGKSWGIASNLLSRRGTLINIRAEEFFKREEIQSYFKRNSSEEKVHIIEILREIPMFSWVLGELLVLSAFTFAHSTSPGYPENRLAEIKDNISLSDTLYDDNLGVARCLTKVGKLTELVFKEMNEVTVFATEIFAFFNEIKANN